MKELCEQVIGDILANRLVGSEELPYARAIADHGGVRAVVSQCCSAIRPEILALQGKSVTRAALDKIRCIQDDDDPWDDPMGYLDYITDDRADKYFRCYAGQCKKSHRRIVAQHAQAILRQSYEFLHYYLL